MLVRVLWGVISESLGWGGLRLGFVAFSKGTKTVKVTNKKVLFYYFNRKKILSPQNWAKTIEPEKTPNWKTPNNLCFEFAKVKCNEFSVSWEITCFINIWSEKGQQNATLPWVRGIYCWIVDRNSHKSQPPSLSASHWLNRLNSGK